MKCLRNYTNLNSSSYSSKFSTMNWTVLSTIWVHSLDNSASCFNKIAKLSQSALIRWVFEKSSMFKIPDSRMFTWFVSTKFDIIRTVPENSYIDQCVEQARTIVELKPMSLRWFLLCWLDSWRLYLDKIRLIIGQFKTYRWSTHKSSRKHEAKLCRLPTRLLRPFSPTIQVLLSTNPSPVE